MANGNPKLAEVLKRRGEPEEILGALVDGGVLIVANPDGSVLVGQLEDESVVLAAFTSPEAYGRQGDESGDETFQQADAALLLEIARTGDVDALVVDPESDDAALILARDAKLETERGQALRHLLYLFEKDEAIRLIRAG